MFLYFKRREKRGKREAPRLRFLVLRRKTLTVGTALLAAAAIFGAVNAPAAVRASVATRQLPIYCVERDQKVCSISFDAAWGGGQHAEDPGCTRGLRRQGDLFRGRQLGGPVSGAGQGHRRQRLRADEPFHLGNVKKCAVGKHPKSEKLGGIGSGCRLRLRPLLVLHRRQPKRVACIDPDAVVVDKNIAKNDRFDLFSR